MPPSTLDGIFFYVAMVHIFGWVEGSRCLLSFIFKCTVPIALREIRYFIPEQARPQTAGEEELQLQLALSMSKEEAESEKKVLISCSLRFSKVSVRCI